MVNAYPLFVEPVPRERRGVLASLFLLCNALGGAVGDPMNGRIFDILNGYRAMFIVMACYTGLAFVAVLFVPRGAAAHPKARSSICSGARSSTSSVCGFDG